MSHGTDSAITGAPSEDQLTRIVLDGYRSGSSPAEHLQDTRNRRFTAASRLGTERLAGARCTVLQRRLSEGSPGRGVGEAVWLSRDEWPTRLSDVVLAEQVSLILRRLSATSSPSTAWTSLRQPRTIAPASKPRPEYASPPRPRHPQHRAPLGSHLSDTLAAGQTV